MSATKSASSFSYLLIGSGRVARNLAHYFQSLDISFETWDRSQDPHALPRKIKAASHALLAISDSALEGFYRQHLAGHDVIVVHFSGALFIPGTIAAHPLMTFTLKTYPAEFYPHIHFVLTGARTLAEALPGLPNAFSLLAPEHKAFYHAQCVLGGNFVTLLMQGLFSRLEELGLPKVAVQAYLEKVVSNTLESPETALTGPLARRDAATVEKNLMALNGQKENLLYQAFVKTYWPEYPGKGMS